MKRSPWLWLALAGLIGGWVGHALPAAPSAQAQTAPTRQVWEYAQLRVQGLRLAEPEPQFRLLLWLTPQGWYQTQNLGDLYQRLGGKGPNPTVPALVNQIGKKGWELVTFSAAPSPEGPDGIQVWTFKRPG